MEDNKTSTYIAILNKGEFEIYGNAYIKEGQNVFIDTYVKESIEIIDGKQQTVTERRFHEITVSKENWLNRKTESDETTSVVIDFVTKDAVMNKPVVQFAPVMEEGVENKSKIYLAYKDYIEAGNKPVFELAQSASFVLRCDDEKCALVLSLHNY